MGFAARAWAGTMLGLGQLEFTPTLLPQLAIPSRPQICVHLAPKILLGKFLIDNDSGD